MVTGKTPNSAQSALTYYAMRPAQREASRPTAVDAEAVVNRQANACLARAARLHPTGPALVDVPSPDTSANSG